MDLLETIKEEYLTIEEAMELGGYKNKNSAKRALRKKGVKITSIGKSSLIHKSEIEALLDRNICPITEEKVRQIRTHINPTHKGSEFDKIKVLFS